MNKYYVNKNARSDRIHPTHKEGCIDMPQDRDRLYLGSFKTCQEALAEANKHYMKVTGCFFCSSDCYSS